MATVPEVLVYHPRSTTSWANWLRENGCPGRIREASNAQEARVLAPEAEVLFAWRFPKEIFPEARRLQWIQAMGAGVDDLLSSPVPEHVQITRVLDHFGGPMAEYVFSELLFRIREIDRVRLAQAETRWDHFAPGSLKGLVMGVAGLGSIGLEVVRKAKAFDMETYGLSRTTKSAPCVDRHFLSSQWPGFVKNLDVLVLVMALTAKTRHSVDREVLRAMKPTALLVNIGRGSLVDELALVEALQDRVIGGAILDVFEKEPLPKESPLWTLEGVTVSSHISGPSLLSETGGYFIDNMKRFIAGLPLAGRVDRAAGY